MGVQIFYSEKVGNEAWGLQTLYSSAKGLFDVLYSRLDSNEFFMVDIYVIDENDEQLFYYKGSVDQPEADMILTWVCYYEIYGDIKEYDKSDPDFRWFSGYLSEVLQDALRAFDDFFIEGDTIDYAFLVLDRIIYLSITCNDKSRRRAFGRIKNNVGKRSSYRLSSDKDPFILSTKTTCFVVREIPFKFRPDNCAFLHLNERAIREHLRKQGVVLRTKSADRKLVKGFVSN